MNGMFANTDSANRMYSSPFVPLKSAISYAYIQVIVRLGIHRLAGGGTNPSYLIARECQKVVLVTACQSLQSWHCHGVDKSEIGSGYKVDSVSSSCGMELILSLAPCRSALLVQ